MFMGAMLDIEEWGVCVRGGGGGWGGGGGGGGD